MSSSRIGSEGKGHHIANLVIVLTDSSEFALEAGRAESSRRVDAGFADIHINSDSWAPKF